MRPVLVAAALFALPSSVACVSDDIPARPVVPAIPVQLVAAPGCGSMSLVVGNGAVYWTESAPGAVRRVSTSGGPITDLATAQDSLGALAVDATSVYWVTGAGKIVMRQTLASGGPTMLVAATAVPEATGNENLIDALLVDAGTLYFGRNNDAAKVSTSGGEPQVIGTSPLPHQGRPWALALDATHLYQTERDHNSVSRERLDGMQVGFIQGSTTPIPLAPDRIAVSQANLVLDAIAVVGGNVVWADDAAIKQKQVDSGEQAGYTQVTTSVGLDPIFGFVAPVTGFVVSGDVVYFGTKADDVEMAPLGANGTATVIATNQMSPGQFAADAHAVYWRTADCQIMKLAK